MTLTVRLDDTLDAELQRHSAERGVTKSFIVQEALAAYLVERRAEKSATPRASANFRAFADAGLLGAGELGAEPGVTGATNAAVRERARARLQRAPR
jgi:predicted transcriptional regulator